MGIAGWEGPRSCLQEVTLRLSQMAGCCRAAGVAGTSMGVAGEAGASRAEEVLGGSCTDTQYIQPREAAGGTMQLQLWHCGSRSSIVSPLQPQRSSAPRTAMTCRDIIRSAMWSSQGLKMRICLHVCMTSISQPLLLAFSVFRLRRIAAPPR